MDTVYISKTSDFFLNFASILYEALPWVILGAALAGVVQEMPPRRAPAVMLALSAVIVALFASPFPLLWTLGPALILGAAVLGLLLLCQPFVDGVMSFLARNRWLAIIMSGLLGLVIPMCECGIIPVTRRLLRKGLPLSCCTTYILAGPIVNVVVLLTTYVAFQSRPVEPSGPAYQMSGLWMLVFRAGLGFAVAVVVGMVVERLHWKYGKALLTESAAPGGLPLVDEEEGPPVSLWRRVGNMSETALHDFVDITVFLIIGALVAALAKVSISAQEIAAWSTNRPVQAIGLMMVFAVMVTLCSEADAFVAANFVTLRPAAKLAFLVLGPMLDFKLILMYTRVFRPRLMWTIIVCVVVQVFVYSYLTHLVWEQYAQNFVQWEAQMRRLLSGQTGMISLLI